MPKKEQKFNPRDSLSYVSCRSDKLWIKNEDAGGLVLYQKDGKNDWYCNGIHCKSGYIIIKGSSSTDKIKVDNDGSMIHNKVYKAVFGEAPDKTVIRGGFAWYKGKWKYNSWSSNAHGKFKDGKKEMNDLEIAEVQRAVEIWMDSKGKTQTIKCKEPLYINEN